MSKCADCNELVGEEWSANNGLCSTCARDEVSKADTNQPNHIVDMHEMVTDTNQAGEDELAKQIESITQAMFVTLSEWQAGVPIDWHSAKAKGRADLLDLIRTEKLKLLAEVRERVVGENERGTITNPDIPSYGEQYESTLADKDELRAALARLEAEQ